MAKQGLTLEQKQKQRLALEQQRLLGTILEKSDAEMEEFIDNKVNEIQALEKTSDDKDDDNGYENEGAQDKSANRDERRENRNDDPISENSGDDDTVAWYRFFANNRSTDDEYYAPTAVSEKTLQEFLNDQLGELELDETQQIIAQAIVGNIEDDGYLRRSTSEIADDVTFNDGYMVDAQQVEEVLNIVQSLDPPGIAARDLRECILLQLRRKPQSEDVDIAITMVEKYFDDMNGDVQVTGSRHRQKSVDGYNRLPEEFSKEDVIHCFGYKGDSSAFVKIKRLMDKGLIEKYEETDKDGYVCTKYRKLSKMGL